MGHLGIYKQFDKVLVLNKGRQVYFGPASEARKYFVSLGYKELPRQTTPEYLTGCSVYRVLFPWHGTDFVEKRIQMKDISPKDNLKTLFHQPLKP